VSCLDYHKLIELVIEFLKRNKISYIDDIDDIDDIIYGAAGLAKEEGIANDTDEHRRTSEDYFDYTDKFNINEIIWKLIIKGILLPGKDWLNKDLPNIHLTEYGKSILKDGKKTRKLILELK